MMNFNDHNRTCHPERVSRSPERSEGEASLGPERETLRGVYPERKRRAQGDNTFPILLVKVHYMLEKWMKRWASFSVLATVVTWVLILAILPLRLAHMPGQPFLHQPTHKLLASNTHTDPTFTPTPTPTLTASAPGDWPTYMADDGHSGFNPAENIITPTTAPQLKLKWTQKAGDYVASQPIEANGLVYWGSWDGFERATNRYNQTVWATYLGVISDPDCDPSSAGVTSSATVTGVEIKGDKISVDFVGGGNGYFYALDAYTGAIIWKTFLGAPPGYYLWSSPSVYNGSVYMGTSSFGDCPLVPGQLVQLDAATGRIQHIFTLVPEGCVGGGVWTSPTIDEATGTVYISTGTISRYCPIYERYALALVELRASDLSFIASWQLPRYDWIRDGDFGATPTLFTTSNGTRMVGLENKNGKYYALKRDAIDKGPVWEARIASGRGSMSSSAWDGHRLYVAGRTVWMDDAYCPGSLAALNPDTGAIIWQHCLTPDQVFVPIGGVVSGAVAAAPGVIAYGQGSYVFVFSAASGKILFSYHDTDADSCFRGWASISNGILYIGNTDGKLLAFAPQ